MKTAMQELINELKEISTAVSKENNLDMVAAFNYAIDLARLNLEKEKQQIKNAYIIGYSDCHSSSAKDQDLYFKLLYNGKDI